MLQKKKSYHITIINKKNTKFELDSGLTKSWVRHGVIVSPNLILKRFIIIFTRK